MTLPQMTIAKNMRRVMPQDPKRGFVNMVHRPS